MGSVVFVSWWGGGNMTPVLSASAAMRTRGHRVTVVGPAQFAARLALDAVDHVPVDGFTPSVEDVRAAVHDVRPDLLVIDFMMGEVLAATPSFDARRTAALVHTMWQPVADRVWDNIAAFFTLARLNQVREAHGLAAVDHAVELLRDVDHILVAMPEPLDRPTASSWPAVRYLGALLEDPGPDAGWQPPAGGEPLVVVSLGTTPMDEEPVVHRVVDAIATIPDVRFLVTVGDHLDPRVLRLGSNTAASRYVRHAAVLPHARLVVSHAGLGTTIAAATYGLPMVCIPLGRDQPGNAARVVELGVGESVTADASAEELRAVIVRMLADADARDAATRLSTAIARRHPRPHDDFEDVLLSS